MAITYKLEHPDGTPAEPPRRWRPRDSRTRSTRTRRTELAQQPSKSWGTKNDASLHHRRNGDYRLASLSSHEPTTTDQNSGCARKPSDS
jgi:hypothetical protein